MQDLLEALDGLAYVVDGEGRIAACGWRRWRAVSLVTKGAEKYAEPDSILGRPLLDFVEGEAVRESYIRFMAALSDGTVSTIGFSFRCDSPGIRRRFRMAITRVEDDKGQLRGLLFQSIPISERARVPMGLFDFEAMRQRLADITTVPLVAMCSYCQRVSFPPGVAESKARWLEAEDYYRQGGPADVCITHTVCPHCQEHVVRRALDGEAPEEGGRP